MLSQPKDKVSKNKKKMSLNVTNGQFSNQELIRSIFRKWKLLRLKKDPMGQQCVALHEVRRQEQALVLLQEIRVKAQLSALLPVVLRADDSQNRRRPSKHNKQMQQ